MAEEVAHLLEFHVVLVAFLDEAGDGVSHSALLIYTWCVLQKATRSFLSQLSCQDFAWSTCTGSRQTSVLDTVHLQPADRIWIEKAHAFPSFLARLWRNGLEELCACIWADLLPDEMRWQPKTTGFSA